MTMLLCETLPSVIKDGKFYKQWVKQKIEIPVQEKNKQVMFSLQLSAARGMSIFK